MKFVDPRRRRGVARWLRAFLLILCCVCIALVAESHQEKTAKPIANFVDIAKKAGLTMVNTFGGVATKKYIIETTGTGVAIFDADNDGWPDIFIVNGTKLDGEKTTGEAASNHLYHNNHDGTFTDITKEAGLVHTGWGQGVCVGDYDNDGWPDVFVTYYGKNVLYHNNGNGTFTDVSEKTGVAGTGKAWGTGCAFVDYDRDGHLDLMVANYVDFDLAKTPAPGERVSCLWKGVPVMCGPQGLPTASNILYHNRGDGTFEDVTKKAQIDKTSGAYAFSVTTLDYDDDGWPDMYVACDSTASILYHNNHDGTFKDVAITAGAAFNEDGHAQAGMGSTTGDYNGDGRLDIFKTNFSDDTATLYRNNGDGTFDDVTFAAGLGLHTQYLGWGTMFFDFDNDGWPDLLLVNGHVYPEVDTQHLGSNFQEPRILYHNNGNGTFADISANAGAGITKASSSRGLAIGDLWNDGKLSAVVSNMNAPPSLLVNEVRSPNNWVAFRLTGSYPQATAPVAAENPAAARQPTRSTRDAIGARIKVKVGGRTLVDEVRSGSSFISNNDMRVHFGLGAATKIDSVEVRWPSGLSETFSKISVDRVNELKEGTGAAANEK
ncbi:MAG TPA: CRTAC1 family protein [Candidatus Acidoferrum sp.]|nr:CRTAC1 family protein [Candidatus Acidoferrum sp.]